MIQTHEEHAGAVDRLKRRSPEALATFIASLALHDGPVGEQVCTFILGDDRAATGADLERRIEALRTPVPRSRQELGRDVGRRLGFILDCIETLVLPYDVDRAFHLLVLVIQSDGDAMENCGDYHFEVSHSIDRAIDLVAQIAPRISSGLVKASVDSLVKSDGYGTRSKLIGLL